MADPMKIRASLKGDVAEIRILMAHAMETGQRKDAAGNVVPAHFIQSMTVEVGGKITARIMCDGRVTISKGGHLDGVVHAKSIAVEKGGVFTGDLFISPTPAQTEDEFFAAEQSSPAGASPVDESEADEPEVDGSEDQEESSDESAPE